MTSAGKILVTGGAGSCGRYLTASLLARGYEVRVIDKDVEPLRRLGSKGLALFQAGLEDRDALKPAVDGVDAVLHLAWSFSEDPLEVLEKDLRGHIYLLEEMAFRKVRHLVYASTAVVYGKPRYSPIDEEHPLRVEEARKPLYGIAKAAAEKLCLMYGKTRERRPPSSVSGGRTETRSAASICGRCSRPHRREPPLEVPADSGGSFLHMADLAQGVKRCLFNPKAYGRTFNLSTVYVAWEEVAEMVRSVTGSRSGIRCVPGRNGRAPRFFRTRGNCRMPRPGNPSDTVPRKPPRRRNP